MKKGQRRGEFLTRLRTDARLFQAVEKTTNGKGRPRQWGGRLSAPPSQAGWGEGEVWIDRRNLSQTDTAHKAALDSLITLRFQLFHKAQFVPI